MQDFFYNIVAYFLIGGAILTVVVIDFFYFRDAVTQVPRFGRALKWLWIMFVMGLLCIGVYMLTRWMPFRLLGLTLAGFPVATVLFITGAFLREAIQFKSGITIAVLGSLGAFLLGVLLLVFKRLIDTGVLFG